ncbi:hypothetical protein KCU93_g9181, partial [Aureobasidium melanogenum]
LFTKWALYDPVIDNLNKLRNKTTADIEKLLKTYRNIDTIIHRITNAYVDFHHKLWCEMTGKLAWTSKEGENVDTDRQTSVLALLMMLGDRLRGAMSAFQLDEADEDALRSLLKRHRQKNP